MNYGKTSAMDLREIVKRLGEQSRLNFIYSFEKGGVVKRTHAAVYADVRTACALLLSFGVKAGMRVGIRAANSYYWIIYDLALVELRAISVALTEDFSKSSNAEVIDKYQLSLILVGTLESTPPDTAVVLLGGENSGIQAIDRGPSPEDPDFAKPGLVFSSGSTGHLKGLILNRRGIEVSVDAFTQAVAPRPDDCLLLFLPISNFQQRLMYYSALWYGFDLVVADPAHLFRALKELHPTILIAPPVLYETIEAGFYRLPAWKRVLARVAGAVIAVVPWRQQRRLLAQLLFQEVHQSLGGSMRFMVTGMAPIQRSTLRLMNLMQLPIYETYGLTEFGSISLNLPGASRLVSVGRPLPGVQVQIAVDGEIIACREHAIAHGYFECGEGEAEKTFIGGNRISTGDIGRVDADGYLYLTGRKKEMIITSSGEKIHPEVIESEINACPDVARSVVFRAPETPFLTAVILPRNPADLKAKHRIQAAVDCLNHHRSSTRVGRLVFTSQAFSSDSGFLRPNLKLDRKRIAEHFQDCA